MYVFVTEWFVVSNLFCIPTFLVCCSLFLAWLETSRRCVWVCVCAMMCVSYMKVQQRTVVDSPYAFCAQQYSAVVCSTTKLQPRGCWNDGCARQRLPEVRGDNHQASRAQRTENALQNFNGWCHGLLNITKTYQNSDKCILYIDHNYKADIPSYGGFEPWL